MVVKNHVFYKLALSSTLTLILLLPIIAYGEPFAVKTNKDIYYTNDKVIVAGILPELGNQNPVFVKIEREGSQCALQTVLIDVGTTFVSRPLTLDNCGPGLYIVTASYSNLTATTTFVISAIQENSTGDDFKMRSIKKFMIMAQDKVNEKIRKLVDANLSIPGQVADKYSKGTSQISLAMQAIDYGDTIGAQDHQSTAFSYFREVLGMLSNERLDALTHAAQDEGTNARQAVAEKLGRLQDLNRRLTDLTEKQNGLSKYSGDVLTLLTTAKNMMDNGDLAGADLKLEAAGKQLELLRMRLIENVGVKNPTVLKDTQAGETQLKKLSEVANSLEKKAKDLLDEAGHLPRAAAKIRVSISLIHNALSSIAKSDYNSATSFLSSAQKNLDEAQRIIDINNHR